jgi:predicted DsbA family dithiol-disulfide isomerase
MGGMIPHWKSYNDPLNSVTKPIQMGPVWMHASEVTHVKMKYSIWHEDPPSSSYPPCIAVKTVGLQSKVAGDQYLYNIRKALMEDGKNISKTEVLFALAKELESDTFDFSLFETDWENGKGTESFRSDLQKTKFHSIGRYPTLTMQNSSGKGIIIVGYRPFEVLEQAFNSINAAHNIQHS